MRNYFYLYCALAIGIMMGGISGFIDMGIHFYVNLFIPLLFIMGIWVYADYRSGNHNRWWKKNYGVLSPSEIRKLKEGKK